MHEVGLAQSIVELVREQARAQAFASVKTVFLRTGALANVEPDALVFGFDSASRGTVAAGARLEVERSPGSAFCASCGMDVVVSSRLEDCPRAAARSC